jgi:hypothetical protein
MLWKIVDAKVWFTGTIFWLLLPTIAVMTAVATLELYILHKIKIDVSAEPMLAVKSMFSLGMTLVVGWMANLSFQSGMSRLTEASHLYHHACLGSLNQLAVYLRMCIVSGLNDDNDSKSVTKRKILCTLGALRKIMICIPEQYLNIINDVGSPSNDYRGAFHTSLDTTELSTLLRSNIVNHPDPILAIQEHLLYNIQALSDNGVFRNYVHHGRCLELVSIMTNGILNIRSSYSLQFRGIYDSFVGLIVYGYMFVIPILAFTPGIWWAPLTMYPVVIYVVLAPHKLGVHLRDTPDFNMGAAGVPVKEWSHESKITVDIIMKSIENCVDPVYC